jgi:hypothetical protein
VNDLEVSLAFTARTECYARQIGSAGALTLQLRAATDLNNRKIMLDVADKTSILQVQ